MSVPSSNSRSGKSFAAVTHKHTHFHTFDIFHLNHNLVISWKLPGAAYVQEENTLPSVWRRRCWGECSICRYRGWINGAGKLGESRGLMHETGKRERDICRGSTLLPPLCLFPCLSLSPSLFYMHQHWSQYINEVKRSPSISARPWSGYRMLKQCAVVHVNIGMKFRCHTDRHSSH